jgi:Flp pilus assembly protein TadG
MNPLPRRRSAAAAAELALLLPFLCLLFIGTVDYARVYYFGVTLENCARNGAYYASDYPNTSYVFTDIYGYVNLNDAIMRDASNLSPPPTYDLSYDTNLNGSFSQKTKPLSGGYAKVTVYWTFNSITNYPFIPSSVNLTRTCIMEISPAEPTFP